MASDDELPSRRRKFAVLLRPPRRRNLPSSSPHLRKMPSVRLGKRRRWWRQGRRILVGALRHVRLRWMAAQYARALKRLRAFYAGLVKDLVEGSAALDAAQARLAMETYFVVPIIPVSLSTSNYVR